MTFEMPPLGTEVINTFTCPTCGNKYVRYNAHCVDVCQACARWRAPEYWVLVKEARNKHYRDAAPDSYESTMQRCFQIQTTGGQFIADLILPVNNAEYVAEMIVEACNREMLARD